jgi:hypothetical protein
MRNSQDCKEEFPTAAFFVGLVDAVEDEVEVGIAVAVAVSADAIEVVRTSGIAMQIFTSKPEISILRIAISSVLCSISEREEEPTLFTPITHPYILRTTISICASGIIGPDLDKIRICGSGVEIRITSTFPAVVIWADVFYCAAYAGDPACWDGGYVLGDFGLASGWSAGNRTCWSGDGEWVLCCYDPCEKRGGFG